MWQVKAETSLTFDEATTTTTTTAGRSHLVLATEGVSFQMLIPPRATGTDP